MSDYPRPTWAEFMRQFSRNWKQGEHVFIHGPTGSGKTELLLNIMEIRTYGVIFVTKPRDPIFTSPFAKRYKRMTSFRPKSTDTKIMLSAPNGDSTRDQVGNQVNVFRDAMDTIYHQKGWTIGVDETLWITNRLKLGDRVATTSYMGRALGLTVVSATQRPANIPPDLLQNATHGFIGKTRRKDDLKRLAELGNDPRELERAINSLQDKHDFVYMDADGRMPLQIVNSRR